MRLTLTLAVFALLVAADTQAATCNITEHPASGILTAERLNQRIRQAETCVNGALGDANISSSEPLALSKIAQPYSTFATSWTLIDMDADGSNGEDLVAGTELVQWQVPSSSTVIGMSVRLFCEADACPAAAASVQLQEDANTIKSFVGVTGEAPSVDFGLNSVVANTDVLNIDIGGTLTSVDQIQVVVYFKTEHI